MPVDQLARSMISLLARYGALVIAAIVAVRYGRAMGVDFASAAYQADEMDAYLSVWAAAALIPMIPAGIVGATRSRGTARVMLGLIALVATGLLIGFALGSGVGGEDGFPVDGIGPGVLVVSLMAAIGGGLGLIVGLGAGGLIGRADRAGATEGAIMRVLMLIALGAIVVFVVPAVIELLNLAGPWR